MLMDLLQLIDPATLANNPSPQTLPPFFYIVSLVGWVGHVIQSRTPAVLIVPVGGEVKC